MKFILDHLAMFLELHYPEYLIDLLHLEFLPPKQTWDEKNNCKIKLLLRFLKVCKRHFAVFKFSK